MKQLFAGFFCLLLITSSSRAQMELDHGAIDAGHEQTTKEFIDSYLKSENKFDAKKISFFIDRLNAEQKSLMQDTYETKIIEKLELNTASVKKAKDKALDELDIQKNELAQGYSLYLIPKMEALLDAVNKNQPERTKNALVQDFVRLYIAYYVPNPIRNMLPQDFQPKLGLKLLTGYTFLRSDEGKIEAFNLRVEKQNEAEISQCMKKNVYAGEYLSQEQVQLLKNCGYDLSKINPGPSALWSPLTLTEKEKAKDMRLDLFPKENEDLFFDEIKYSGQASPKISAYAVRNGKKVKFKIKMGSEVHSEVAATVLSKTLGLHQDHVIARPLVKVLLKDVSFSEFESLWKRKYRGLNRDLGTYLQSKGGEKGKEWIVMRDVEIEAKDPDRIRLSSYMGMGWDLKNRREHRASIIWQGWLNVTDAKPSNHVVNLVKMPDGSFVPEYSQQDLGLSLRWNLSPMTPLESLQTFFSFNVNGFSSTFVKADSKKVRISVAGWYPYETTTYADAKWMARKIAALTFEDIQYAFQMANLPKPVEDLYALKVANRRNELVKAFELEDEFPLFDIPNLNKYSPNEYIKNGRIVVDSFKGYALPETSSLSLAPDLIDTLTSYFPLEWIENSFNAKLTSQINASAFKVKELVQGEEGPKIDWKGIFGDAGISINRTVSFNDNHVNYSPDNTQSYVVRDTVVLELSISTGIVAKYFESLPISVNGKISIYRKEFQMIHYANTFQQGYIKPFRMVPFLYNFRKAVVNNLKAGEAIKIQDSYGISGGSSQTVPIGTTGLNAVFSEGVSWTHSKPVYFGRDSLMQLFVYKGNQSQWGMGLSTDLTLGMAKLKIPLISEVPILGAGFGMGGAEFDSTLYSFDLPAYEMGGANSLDKAHFEKEFDAFNKFMDSDMTDLGVMGRQDLNVTGKSKSHDFKLDLLVLFHGSRNSDFSEVDVKLDGGEHRSFLRAYNIRQNAIGSDIDAANIAGGSIRSLTAKTVAVDVEIDKDKLEDSVCLIDYMEYDRKFKRKRLDKHIEKLNRQFSSTQKSEDKFFRDYLLPKPEEVKKYKKLYSRVKIYMDCGELFSRLNAMKDSEIDAAENAIADMRRDRPMRQLASSLKSYKEGKLSARMFSRRVGRYLGRYFFKGGDLTSFKSLFGAKNLFVVGEIMGIIPSYSSMQGFEANMDRRFAAKSWGDFEGVPPIRKFLSQHNLTFLNPQVKISSTMDTLFGTLPNVDAFDVYF